VHTVSHAEDLLRLRFECGVVHMVLETFLDWFLVSVDAMKSGRGEVRLNCLVVVSYSLFRFHFYSRILIKCDSVYSTLKSFIE
jgi:hypothetical protein